MPHKIRSLSRFKLALTMAMLALLQIGLLPGAAVMADEKPALSAELTLRHGIGKRPGVAHGTLHNKTANELKLVAVDSDMFARIEIHTMSMDDGIMRMRRLDGLALPAGETVPLKPGGLHLMLFGYRGAARDKTVPMRLTLLDKNGDRTHLNVMVSPKAMAQKDHHRHH